MALPDFNEHGLLPVGVHDGTLAEVEEQFGRFQSSDHRMRLFGRLCAYVDEVRRAGCGAAIVVDGSFVMPGVDEPGDIDLILVLPADWDFAAELRPFEYNLESRHRVRRRFGFDVFPVTDASDDYNAWVAYFQQVRPEHERALHLPKGVRKGLVRIAL